MRLLPGLLLAPALLAASLAPPAGAQEDPVDRLRGPVGDWIEARSRRAAAAEEQAIATLERIVEELRHEHPGVEPLARLTWWSEAIETGRHYDDEALPRGAWSDLAPAGPPGRLWLPAGYDSAQRSWPLVLLLEDLDGMRPRERLALFPAIARRAVVLAPALPEVGIEELDDDAARFRILPALGEVFRRLRIDRDRVHLLGAGPLGGTLAGAYATLLPHFFCTLVIVDAPTLEDELLRQYYFDRERLGAVGAWQASFEPRRSAPPEFRVNLTEAWAGRAWWVQAVRFEPRPRGSGSGGGSAWLHLEADRASNTIHLESERVDRIRLFLNDELVDLDRPVTLVRNGHPYRFQLRRSVRVLLENFALNQDARALYPAILRAHDLPAGNP